MSARVFENVYEILSVQAQERPDAVALEDARDLRVSYGQLFAKVGALIDVLHGLGVGRGARVAIVLPNGVEMAITLLGVTCVATAVPLNPVYRREEYRAYFDEIRVGFLLTRKGFQSEARAVASEKGVPILELSSDGKLELTSDERRPAGSGLAERGDVALVLLTSGSTGRSKKVPLTHRNICVSTRDICRTLALGPADRCLCMWEQFHVGGLVDLLLVPLASGGTVICAGGFDAARFYELLEAKQPTWFQGVPTTLNELSVYAKKSLTRLGVAPLRFIRSVAAALSPQLMEEIESLFNVPVIQTFGMTEAGPLITTNLLPPAPRKPGSVGPSCGPEIRIEAPDGTPLPSGEIGEVAVRGENVVAGYEDAPEANAHSFRGGWFHTGDTGYLDSDGHLFLKGRLKEMINRGGEKITLQEIDDVLLAHPAIAQAATFSVKHRTLGEDVAAAVVLRTPGAVSEAEIRGFVAQRLAEFKVPQRVLILEAMPRDPIGKVNRLTLATLADSLAAPKAAAGAENEIERKLSQIWAEELSLPQVGLDENFFAIGGNSLSGVRMLIAAEDAFGIELPANALVDHVTVRQMAKLLDPDAAPAAIARYVPDGLSARTLSDSQLRRLAAVMGAGGIPPLRPGSTIKAANLGGSRRPLVWCFNKPQTEMPGLLRHLDPDQPLLGLYSGSGQLPNTDDAIAKTGAHYAEELLKLYPDAQFTLGGNCHGGGVAHQIDKAFRAAGKPIERVCYLEYFDPELFDHTGKLMLIYGRHSDFKVYQPILAQGVTGWEKRFRRAPILEWVSGEHGKFFQRPYSQELAAKVVRFLADEPQAPVPFESVRLRARLAIHASEPLFDLFIYARRLATLLRYGDQKERRAEDSNRKGE
jgi:acyl-CoA synthetase (AMP-forming)/AMP-acid ligase II/acyl carrier protein